MGSAVQERIGSRCSFRCESGADGFCVRSRKEKACASGLEIRVQSKNETSLLSSGPWHTKRRTTVNQQPSGVRTIYATFLCLSALISLRAMLSTGKLCGSRIRCDTKSQRNTSSFWRDGFSQCKTERAQAKSLGNRYCALR